MTVTPLEWNVIVAGRWNPAILTPSGIAQRLFRLPKGQPIEIQINLDGPVVFRVLHDNIIAQADFANLRIDIQRCDVERMTKATACAEEALNSLPETPVSAAGINFRYSIIDARPELGDLTTCALDRKIADSLLTIADRSVRRGVNYGAGRLNIQVDHNDTGAVFVTLNFHKGSSDRAHLVDWLNQPVSDLYQKVCDIMSGVLNTPVQEDIKNA